MKRSCILLLALAMTGCSPSESSAPVDIPPKVTAFITQKEMHAQTLASLRSEEKVPRDVWDYFRLAREGKWRAASRLYQDLRRRSGQVESSQNKAVLLALQKAKLTDPNFVSTTWCALLDLQLALEAYIHGEPKYSTAFAEGIVQSIPRGSIFFGGTDPGRGLVASFLNWHMDGDPFFALTQNQLADGRYINYLSDTYSGKIQTPTDQDWVEVFQTYLDDARRRFEHDRNHPSEPRQLKPGENVKIVDDKVEVPMSATNLLVTGEVPVIAICGLMTKVIFDKNPDREFYIEESFQIDWMYPHLAPHGLIMKIHRKPLLSLTPEMVAKDREFWIQQQKAMIGDWLTPSTPVEEVCEFAEKIFLKKDLTGFRGDPLFVRSDYATATYSKLRSNLAGLYNWRIAHANSGEGQQRMIREADFAFRQSFALSPVNPESIYDYANLLVQLGRYGDALLIARTAARLEPKNAWHQNLISELERFRDSQPNKSVFGN